MVFFYIDQQERLKTARGKEMLDTVPVYDVVPTNVASPPADLGGKVEISLGKDGKVIARIKGPTLR